MFICILKHKKSYFSSHHVDVLTMNLLMHVSTHQLSSEYEGLEHLMWFPDSKSLCLVISLFRFWTIMCVGFPLYSLKGTGHPLYATPEQWAENKRQKNHRLTANMYRTISASDQRLAVGNHPPDCSFLLPPPCCCRPRSSVFQAAHLQRARSHRLTGRSGHARHLTTLALSLFVFFCLVFFFLLSI